jgi:hypothetical protein
MGELFLGLVVIFVVCGLYGLTNPRIWTDKN